MNYQWPIKPEYQVIRLDFYGLRERHYMTGRKKFHSGFDITAKTETPVRPMCPGIVVRTDFVGAGNNFNVMYGNKIEILHDDGNKAIYAHLRSINVMVGQRVDYNTIIAMSGCSGAARVPHLHFEIREGNDEQSGISHTINPLKILPRVDWKNITKEFDQQPYCQLWEKLKDNPWNLDDKDIAWNNDKDLVR